MIFTKTKVDRDLEKKYSKEFVITYVGNTSKRRGLLTVIDSLKIIQKVFQILSC